MSLRKMIVPIFVVMALCAFQLASAQVPTTKIDSSSVYDKIDSLAQQNKTVKMLQNLLIKNDEEKKSVSNRRERSGQVNYDKYKGKIIRHVYIKTYDPFSSSVDDTTRTDENFLQKTGNTLHLKSKQKTIKNLLLLQEGAPFDPLRAKESERLIRGKDYVRDLFFSVEPAQDNPEQVNIYIRVLDMWSILPQRPGNNIVLTDRNFLGLGHQFKHTFNNQDKYYGIDYVVSNIGSSYISGGVGLGVDHHGHVNRRLSFNRRFFSPLTKWAGGISISFDSHSDTVGINPSPSDARQFAINAQDLWGGSSIQLIKGNSEYSRSTNLISAVRLLRVRYPIKPLFNAVDAFIFDSEDFYLGSLGISTQQFLKEKYIFKFGTTEDLPIGKVINITTGYQLKGNRERTYWGARVSFAEYHPWGYLSSQLEYGSFFKSSKSEQGAISMGINYFTHLKQMGKWRFRQLIKSDLTIGINPFATDSLTINSDVGLAGFSSSNLWGTRRAVITLQTQSYAPFNFLGFRFGPYVTLSGALLGNDEDGFKNSKLYTQFGLGVLIRNENLVLNTFQISLAFYPSMPGQGNNIFRFNSLRSTDFGFNYFVIGKPNTVVFQ